MSVLRNIFVTGGAGYVGSVLVPKLLRQNYRVKVLDLCLFGTEPLESVRTNPNFKLIQGDLRDKELLAKELPGANAVIHLACISNDPSFELNPRLGKSINYDCFPDLVVLARKNGVSRFIYASSSSVYGVREEENVTEDLALKPLTDYSKYKALCEEILLQEQAPGFAALILRPATVCGFSPRLRLDLTVNILTNHAFTNNKIKVFGGDQKRPNIHIADMTDLYLQALAWPAEAISGRIFNAGYENHTVSQIAELVRGVVGGGVAIETIPTDDHRSYHISSEKIRRELGFVPRHSIEQAVKELLAAFKAGRIPNSMTDSRYFNIKRMQELSLQ